MDTGKLKKFAQQARRSLIELTTGRLKTVLCFHVVASPVAISIAFLCLTRSAEQIRTPPAICVISGKSS